MGACARMQIAMNRMDHGYTEYVARFAQALAFAAMTCF